MSWEGWKEETERRYIEGERGGGGRCVMGVADGEGGMRLAVKTTSSTTRPHPATFQLYVLQRRMAFQCLYQ